MLPWHFSYRQPLRSKSVKYRKRGMLPQKQRIFINPQKSPAKKHVLKKRRRVVGLHLMQISAFYFPTLEKAYCTKFALSVGRLVAPLNFPSTNIFLLFLFRFSSPPEKNSIFLLQIFSSFSLSVFLLLRKKYFLSLNTF